MGEALDLFNSEPDPDDHGHVLANRTQPQAWEGFTMSSLQDDQVTILSHVGLFSARGGGGSGVYANRIAVGPWETWHLVHNGDGTVSLRTQNGHFFVAEDGGGRECNANRSAIGV